MLEKLYKTLRVLIYAIPVISIITGLYLILFPIESFNYYPENPELSKLEISQAPDKKTINFGVFPMRGYPNVDLRMEIKTPAKRKSCLNDSLRVEVRKTYQSFLYPEGEEITNADQLRDFLFRDNKTSIPNGSLLHLKPTNEVFLVSRGKRILFSGPEIFLAFGYSFDNLIDVDKSTLDKFPEADDRVLLWTHPHPDGMLFQAFPSHKVYLSMDGKKYPIASKELLDEVWKENYLIPVSDEEAGNVLECRPEKEDLANQKLHCLFDSRKFSASLGRYYYFSVKLLEGCGADDISVQSARINFISEKSYATAKDSLRNIFASILNRYIYQRYNIN